MENELFEYFYYETIPTHLIERENYYTNTIRGIMQWLDVTMKDYTDAQYGKGDIKKLINYDEIKMLERNV